MKNINIKKNIKSGCIDDLTLKRIVYGFNRKKVSLEDFHFYLYFIDSLKSDWKEFFNDNYSKLDNQNLSVAEIRDVMKKTINIIVKHLNKQEFEKFIEIHDKLKVMWYVITPQVSNKATKFLPVLYQVFKTDLLAKAELLFKNNLEKLNKV